MTPNIGTLSILPPEIRDHIYRYVAPTRVLVYYPQESLLLEEELESRRLVRALQMINHEAMQVIFRQTTLAYDLDLRGTYFSLPSLHPMDDFTRLALRLDLTQYHHEDTPGEAASRCLTGVQAETLTAAAEVESSRKIIELEYHGCVDRCISWISPQGNAHFDLREFLHPLKRLLHFAEVSITLSELCFWHQYPKYDITGPLQEHSAEIAECRDIVSNISADIEDGLLPALGPVIGGVSTDLYWSYNARLEERLWKEDLHSMAVRSHLKFHPRAPPGSIAS